MSGSLHHEEYLSPTFPRKVYGDDTPFGLPAPSLTLQSDANAMNRGLPVAPIAAPTAATASLGYDAWSYYSNGIGDVSLNKEHHVHPTSTTTTTQSNATMSTISSPSFSLSSSIMPLSSGSTPATGSTPLSYSDGFSYQDGSSPDDIASLNAGTTTSLPPNPANDTSPTYSGSSPVSSSSTSSSSSEDDDDLGPVTYPPSHGPIPSSLYDQHSLGHPLPLSPNHLHDNAAHSNVHVLTCPTSVGGTTDHGTTPGGSGSNTSTGNAGNPSTASSHHEHVYAGMRRTYSTRGGFGHDDDDHHSDDDETSRNRGSYGGENCGYEGEDDEDEDDEDDEDEDDEADDEAEHSGPRRRSSGYSLHGNSSTMSGSGGNTSDSEEVLGKNGRPMRNRRPPQAPSATVEISEEPERRGRKPAPKKRGRKPSEKTNDRLSKKDRNKLSAMKYRKKRKMFLEGLEGKVEHLESLVSQQKDTIALLLEENKRLQHQILTSRAANHSIMPTGHATSSSHPQTYSQGHSTSLATSTPYSSLAHATTHNGSGHAAGVGSFAYSTSPTQYNHRHGPQQGGMGGLTSALFQSQTHHDSQSVNTYAQPYYQTTQQPHHQPQQTRAVSTSSTKKRKVMTGTVMFVLFACVMLMVPMPFTRPTESIYSTYHGSMQPAKSSFDQSSLSGSSSTTSSTPLIISVSSSAGGISSPLPPSTSSLLQSYAQNQAALSVSQPTQRRSRVLLSPAASLGNDDSASPLSSSDHSQSPSPIVAALAVLEAASRPSPNTLSSSHMATLSSVTGTQGHRDRVLNYSPDSVIEAAALAASRAEGYVQPYSTPKHPRNSRFRSTSFPSPSLSTSSPSPSSLSQSSVSPQSGTTSDSLLLAHPSRGHPYHLTDGGVEVGPGHHQHNSLLDDRRLHDDRSTSLNHDATVSREGQPDQPVVTSASQRLNLLKERLKALLTYAITVVSSFVFGPRDRADGLPTHIPNKMDLDHIFMALWHVILPLALVLAAAQLGALDRASIFVPQPVVGSVPLEGISKETVSPSSPGPMGKDLNERPFSLAL